MPNSPDVDDRSDHPTGDVGVFLGPGVGTTGHHDHGLTPAGVRDGNLYP
ncbi:hypothetical protein OG625_38155 [Streptomyces sp. NBC_01351]|nr:hypothetical protein [Streptomyces sp. NBC_01351]